MGDGNDDNRLTRISDRASKALSLAERQKARLDTAFWAFGFILPLLLALGAFNTYRDLGPHRQVDKQQSVLADLFLGELEQDIVALIRELTLSSITKPQQQRIVRISDHFESSNDLLKRQPRYAESETTLSALTLILIEDNPGDAITLLEELDRSSTSVTTESMTLVLLGLAYHIKKAQDEGTESYSRKAELFFERATQASFKIGLAFNGLAVQRALKAFDRLERNEIDESLLLLREATRHFAAASATDGTLVAYYKYLNNTTYIKAKLLAFFLDGDIDELRLAAYFSLDTLGTLVKQIDSGFEQAETFSRGNAGAPFTSAECLSITGEYYAGIGRAPEANRRFNLSKRKHLEAIDKDLYRGRDRKQIEKSMRKKRLLEAMLAKDTNFDDLLSYAAG